MTPFLATITWGRPLSVGLLAVIGLGILAWTLYSYTRTKHVKNGLRYSLAALRILVLLLIVFVLLEPNITETKTITRKQHLPVLLDVSQSMSLKDQRKQPQDLVDAATALGLVPFDDATDANTASMQLVTRQRAIIAAASRLDLAGSLVTKSGRDVFDALAAEVDVNYYTFGDTVSMIGGSDDETMKALGSLKAVQTGTSIADSLEAVVNARGGAPLAGIVLISDGIDTSARRTEALVNDLGTRGIPVFAIPMGIADPDDVSIRSLIMQDVAFTGDTVPLRVQILSKGYEKRDVDLVLEYNGEEVERKAVVLRGGVQYEELAFDVISRKKGAAEIEVRVEPFADESTPNNNRVARSLRVVNEKINVLCIEGSARWEFRYLRAILKRDPRIDAKFIATRSKAALSQLSSEFIARFPEDPEEAFKYDLVILGDVDAAFFTDVEMARLEELVRERGGSLLMLCGRRFAPASYVSTDVEKMLPVRFDPDAEWEEVDETVHPVITAEGRSSLVMTLEHEQGKNDAIWSTVAPLNEVPPLTTAKRGAIVLAELSDSESDDGGYPLISWQRYGTGKCMVIGSDNLWRLRFKTGDHYHWRMWSQCIQFLTLSRLMGEHRHIRLETDRVSYVAGNQVRIYASVLDEAYEAVSQPNYTVVVRSLGEADAPETTVTLRPNPANPGQYEGYFSPQTLGRYRLEPNPDDVEAANSIEFQISERRTEMAQPEAQIERLQRLAKLSGGKLLSVSQLPELGALVNTEPETITVHTPKSIWDHWLLMVLIIGLLGSEWIIRRKRDLA
ncbi:MAG: putative membrane protein [Rhodothermales bacterium]|jgi:uncharacterized membrane protein